MNANPQKNLTGDCKFTPGPWKAYVFRFHNGELSGVPHIDAPNQRAALRRVCDLEPKQLGELEANARLIASAPDLLAACERSLRIFQAWKCDANPCGDLNRGESADYDAACDSCELLEAVIAKAKGVE